MNLHDLWQTEFYNQKGMKTPNLDTLGQESIIFERAYCQITVCSPSRNSFLSGRRPDSIGVVNFMDNFRSNFPTAVSLPQYFKRHGYVTLGAGKTFQPDSPPNYDAPHSWSHELDYLPLMKNMASCHMAFDDCPEERPQQEFMDQHTADYAISAIKLAKNLRKKF